MKILSFVLFLLALLSFCISGNLLYKRFNPQQLSFNQTPVSNSGEIKPYVPIKLEIPSQNITLPIFPAQISNNHWETTDKGVSYVISSAIPGETGNSILYGHNFTNILGSLPNVKPGEKIIITFTNGVKRTFTTDKTAIVSPSDGSVLDATKEKTLTIYTCTGFLDTKRFVVKALLTSELAKQ